MFIYVNFSVKYEDWKSKNAELEMFRCMLGSFVAVKNSGKELFQAAE